MTSPVSVGVVSVEVIADARALAKSLRKEFESAFKGLDIRKAIRDSIGSTKIKIPVEPDVDTGSIPEKVKKTRVPKVPVELDPLLSAFQREVRRQTAELARTVNAKIPVGADTTGLRTELSASLAAIDRELKAHVGTEPADGAGYALRLKTLVDEVAAKIKAKIKIEPEVNTSGLSGSAFNGISGLFKSLIPDIGGIGSAISGLAQGVQKFALEAAAGGSQLGGSIAAAAGPIGTVIALLAQAGTFMGALGAAAIFVVPAMTAVAGAAAAIPAALSGLGAVFGTLGLGFKGISEAFKPVTGRGGGGAGGSATNQARQVAAAGRSVEAARRGIAQANRSLEASERGLAAAQRGVASAQRAVLAAQRGVVSAQQTYADSELAVADAQRRSIVAQQALSRARQDAAEDIDDLNRSLRGAQLSEEDAALSVTEALRALNSAKLTGDIPSIQRADLAYREALQTLDEAKDTTDDLSKSTTDANTKGVEGSDKVVSALQDQQDALRAVTDAQRGVQDSAQGIADAQQGVLDAQNGIIDATDNLKSAQDGVLSAQDGIRSATDGLISAQDALAQSQQKVAAGAAATAAKVIRLAPAAQAFVDAVKRLKPAFEDLRLDVQQRLFEGLDKTVTHLGDAWIPALKVTLGSYADTFNGFFKDLGANVSKPQFINDIQVGAEGARQGLEKIGKAVSGPLVEAFGKLSAAAGPFLSQLGGEIAKIVTKFSEWIIQADKSGRLQTFFEKASKALSEISTTGRLVGSIIGDIFRIITGAQTTTGKSPLDSFNDALQKVDTYLKDPGHQAQIQKFVQDLGDGLTKFGQAADKVNGFLDRIGVDGSAKSSSVGGDIGRALVAGLIAGVGEALKLSAETWLMYFSPFGPLVQPIKDALGIKSPSTVFADIGHNLIDGLIKGVTDFFPNLSAKAGEIRTTVTNRLSDAGSWLTTHGRSAIGGLQEGMNTAYAGLRTTAGNARVTVQNALSTAGSWLTTHGQNAVTGLRNGMITQYGNLSSTASGLHARISNTLSDAGNWLLNHGRAVVIGLTNGIINQIPGLGSVLSYVTDFIKAHKGPIEKDRVLLTPAGEAIMDGLIDGMTGKKNALAGTLTDLTSLVADTSLPGLGLAADAAISSSLSVASQKTLQIGWAPGANADPVLTAFRNLISVQYRGDVQAALGS